MKIDTTHTPSHIRSTKNLRRTQQTSKTFTQVLNESSLENIETTTPPAALLSTYDILSVQEKGVLTPQERGDKMLEKLELLFREMILGHENTRTLQEMAYSLEGKKQNCPDPRLRQILNQIEQRVAVELAKRGYYSSA